MVDVVVSGSLEESVVAWPAGGFAQFESGTSWLVFREEVPEGLPELDLVVLETSSGSRCEVSFGSVEVGYREDH